MRSVTRSMDTIRSSLLIDLLTQRWGVGIGDIACRCWHDQRRVILHRLHDLPVAVGADDLGHGSDREDLSRLRKGHGAQKGDHLVRHEFSTHTPYLAHHCR